MELKNQTVLIIGGSSGIGLATARVAIDLGAKVIIAGRSLQKLEKATTQLGNKTKAYPADMADKTSLERLFSNIEALDHLFISAGDPKGGFIKDTPMEDIRPSFDARFWGTFCATRLAAEMIHPNGSITYMSGNLAVKPGKGSAVGSAGVAAVEAFARGMALELAPVRVNVIRAGLIDTPLLDRYKDQRQTIIKSVSKRLPLKRIGLPEEVAHGAIYLMTNRYTTGTILQIDGGGLLV